jgi:hypothetical protein
MDVDDEAEGLEALVATATTCYRGLFEPHSDLAVRKRADGGTVFGSGGGLDAVERSDGDSYFAQMLQIAMLFVDLDPAETAFILPYQTPTCRHMDNGADSVYGMAFVDDQHRYRVSGRRADECYLAITLYAADSGQPDRLVWAANHIDLGIAPGDPFEVELSPSDGAVWVNTRQYFHNPRTDQAGSFQIDVVDGPPSRRASAAGRREGWRRAVRFLESVANPEMIWDPPPPWVSQVPNSMGDPSGWQADARAAKDQIYASGTFDLNDDEMLVLETRWPNCAYASATVWNRFSQSVDRRLHASSMNNNETVADADGTVRLVVAGRDPGLPNWLDTGGRRRGTVFWRFLLPEGPVHPIASRVAQIGDF